MDAETCKKRGGTYMQGICFGVPSGEELEKSRERNELWSDFMNNIYYPAPPEKKKTMLKRMLTSYWQMHGTKLELKEVK